MSSEVRDLYHSSNLWITSHSISFSDSGNLIQGHLLDSSYSAPPFPNGA
ncbi:uncharacterized protein ANIA_11472 [Aspergillus nidulans FGSC A4]|uniref:Uncharacterized protein n=1 Tax=Emericella nidulans (strain FGSC A4 / ATCC 38163 / CBS 112.46 / NRRL 194 / M139) TaxID=227321 RepID=C8VFB9_EMENI|nr:hypothetical protein [Aspergillus nidulans FGSC A4]CBF81150.1 TPA: hypothetical protein ANIA_11472 [Aspergillus nidulans FGSC A4]